MCTGHSCNTKQKKKKPVKVPWYWKKNQVKNKNWKVHDHELAQKTARGQKIKDTIVIVALLHTIAILLKYTYRQNPLFRQLQIIFLSHISIIWNDFLLLLTENSKMSEKLAVKNPWLVDIIQDFWFLKCPECEFKAGLCRNSSSFPEKQFLAKVCRYFRYVFIFIFIFEFFDQLGVHGRLCNPS